MSDSESHKQQPADEKGAKPRSKRAYQQKGVKRPHGPSKSDHRRPGGRHQARILALQVLYEVDVTDHLLADVLGRTTEDPGQAVPSTVRVHVDRLVRGVLDRSGTIDRYIGDAAPAFPVNQLPAVDRNVLRLAIYELLSEPEVPPKAAINEAVELAKRFGGMNSGRFVNGVLGTVTDRLSQGKLVDDSTTSASDSVAS
ncbi:MAG: transcription antitermination factor NusB [Thermomicrobiales bacterium]